MEPPKTLSKYKNVFSNTPTKTLYGNLKIDQTATTKIRCNENFFAVPFGTGNVGIFPIMATPETIKIENNCPLTLGHGKPIQDYEFSPLESSIIATCTKNDGLIRIWKIPDDVNARPNIQSSQREVTSADIYLAGHEKKVEMIKFHPSVGSILLSSSIDSTIRLWEIEMMQDRITLFCPNEGIVQSISFDYNGQNLAASSNDAFINLYDIRAGSNPTHSITSQLNPNKGCKISWLTPDPLIAVSGFKEKGSREILLFDTRAIDKGPVQTLVVQGSGVGILNPIWDPALPLLYMLAKGEGVRVFELGNGEIKELNTLKVEKQATAFDILPKSVCVTQKCEIARFIRLGTDNAVETTSIHVPRVNGESVYQEDLYPAIATIDPQADVIGWLGNICSVDPMMVEFSTLQSIKSVASYNHSKESSNNNAKIVLKSKGTFRRAHSLSNVGHGSNGSIAASLGSIPLLNDQISAQLIVYMDGFLYIEKRGWFGSVWEKHYFSLKKTRLYVFSDSDSEVPLFYISFSQIKKIDGFVIGRESVLGSKSNQLGILIETVDKTLSLKAESHVERNSWLEKIKKAISINNKESITKETQSSAASTMRSNPMLSTTSNMTAIGNREGAALFGEIKYLSSSDLQTKSGSKPQWVKRVAVLDEEGFIHIYPEDMKAFTQGKPPLESMNLNVVISVRLTDIIAGQEVWGKIDESVDTQFNVFQINTTKRVSFFQTRSPYEAANWVLEIRRIITLKDLLPASELVALDVSEGVILDMKTPSGESIQESLFGIDVGKVWLSVIDGSFYYFQSYLSTNPLHVIKSSQFEDVKTEDEESVEPSSHNRQRSRSSAVRPSLSSKFLSKNHCYFEVALKTMNVRHYVQSVQERGIWLKELTRIRMDSYDLLGKVGIDKDQLLREEIAKAKGDVFASNEEMKIVFLDDKKIEKGEQTALIAAVGKANLVIAFVECHWKSLKNDGSFVLDAGMSIYHWNGQKSSRMCQARAMGVANRLRKDRGTKPKVHLVENDDTEMVTRFLGLLGLQSTDQQFKQFLSSISISDQLLIDKTPPFQIFKVVQTQIRKRKLQLIYEGFSPSKSILESESVYILQCSPGEIFVWCGKNSPTENKALGQVVSRRMASQMQKSELTNCVGGQWITVQRVYEGAEYAVWKEKFIDYEGSLPISMRMAEKKGNIAREIKQEPIDVLSLLNRTPFIDSSGFEGDTSNGGTFKVYRVKDFQKEEVKPQYIGQFFRGESYIVFFVYRPPNSGVDKCISYFWQGSESTITEKGTSALMTIELSEQTKGDVTQVRVVEGKEMLHLYRLFDGLITRLGVSTSEVNSKSEKCFEIREYLVGGVCKAIECEIQELNFNSHHVTIILNEFKSYIWHGTHCLENEKQYAINVAKKFSQCASTIIKEGEKFPQDLAKLMHTAGNKYYEQNTMVKDSAAPRLFSCNSRSGMVKIEEITNFTQEDLDSNIVMILDIHETIYAWIGLLSKTNEKVTAMESVQKYLELSTTHKKTAALKVVYAYQEPLDFTRVFHGWTVRKMPKDKRNLAVKELAMDEVLKEFRKVTYPVDVLLSEKLPENVDKTKLEMYLSVEDFEAIFGMSRDDYLLIQPWKRNDIRRKLGFF